MRTIPIDSTDAREQRESEAEEEAREAAVSRAHAAQCRGGWLGLDDDERPIPCLQCRPWLVRVNCRGCSAPARSCQELNAIRRGPCCPDCDHDLQPTDRSS